MKSNKIKEGQATTTTTKEIFLVDQVMTSNENGLEPTVCLLNDTPSPSKMNNDNSNDNNYDNKCNNEVLTQNKALTIDNTATATNDQKNTHLSNSKKTLPEFDQYGKLPPCSIMWVNIPCITYILPFVGHMAITDSRGVVFDFGGSYYVNNSKKGYTIFGKPCRYYTFWGVYGRSQESRDIWDNAIYDAIVKFEKMEYSFCTNNCHHFVCQVLNNLGLNKKKNNMTNLVARYFFKMGCLLCCGGKMDEFDCDCCGVSCECCYCPHSKQLGCCNGYCGGQAYYYDLDLSTITK